MGLQRVEEERELHDPAVRDLERPRGAVVAGVTLFASRVARARCSALVTDATLVSRSSATSDAFQRSTSHRISTARCFGGRCCSAAPKHLAAEFLADS